MADVLDCDIVISKFELHWERYEPRLLLNNSNIWEEAERYRRSLNRKRRKTKRKERKEKLNERMQKNSGKRRGESEMMTAKKKDIH